MHEYIKVEEFYRQFNEEMRAAHRRGELLRLYEGNWTDEEWEEMSNRKRAKIGRRENESLLGPPVVSLKYNAYVCITCGMGYLTVDLHEGVTPMIGPCFATEGCGGRAQSMMYPDGDPPADFGPAIIYWYRPTSEEFAKLPPVVQEHVQKGGLARKASDDAPDWVKAIA